MKKWKEIITEIPLNIDTIITLILGFGFACLGIVGNVSPNLIMSGILLLMTLVAFFLFKNQITTTKSIEKMDKVLNTANSSNADHFFSTGTEEKGLLTNAEKEICFIQETGNLITEKNRAEMITFLNKGGVIKIIITSPEPNTARSMAFRNASLDEKALINRGDLFESHLTDILRKVDVHSVQVEVRYLPYPIGFTAVVVDPDNPTKSKRRALIRYADFRVPFEEKLDFQVVGNESEKTLAHYYQQFQNMKLHSYKFLLLTGNPRSGKTTLFHTIIEKYRKSGGLFYVISQEKKVGDKRVGFQVITSSESLPKEFARKKDDGSYDVDVEVWDQIADQLVAKRSKVILLDEIGPMQLKSSRFKEAVEELLRDKNTTVFATIAKEDDTEGFIERIKRHHRTAMLELSEQNRSEIVRAFTMEMEGSLTLHQSVNVRGE